MTEDVPYKPLYFRPGSLRLAPGSKYSGLIGTMSVFPEPELSGTRRLPGLRIGERPSGMVSCDIRALASNKQRRTNSGVTRGCGGPVSGPAGFAKYHIKPNDSYLTWRV